MHTGLMLSIPGYLVIYYGLLLIVPFEKRTSNTSVLVFYLYIRSFTRLQKTWRICTWGMEVRLYMLHFYRIGGFICRYSCQRIKKNWSQLVIVNADNCSAYALMMSRRIWIIMHSSALWSATSIRSTIRTLQVSFKKGTNRIICWQMGRLTVL